MNRRILKSDESYTFRRYFELKFAPEDILQELGANLERANLVLPKSQLIESARFESLRQRLNEAIALSRINK